MGRTDKKVQNKSFKADRLLDERYGCRLMGKCFKCDKKSTDKYYCEIYQEKKIPPDIWCGQSECLDYTEEN